MINIGFDILHKVDVITIMLSHFRLQLKVKKCTVKLNYNLEGRFYKLIFPLALAYVMIGHKSQGITFSSKVLVNIKNAFTLGLTYVMLSKVTKKNYLTIAPKLHVDDFSLVKYTSK